jgi:hypothetical protein
LASPFFVTPSASGRRGPASVLEWSLAMFRLPNVGPWTRPLLRVGRPLAVLTVAALIVSSVSLLTAATSLSLRPVADTWVNPLSATANYGTGATLRIDGSPTWNAYLRFDLGRPAGTLTSAVLKLYPNSSSRGGLSVHRVASTTWNEGATTAANAPAMGTVAVASGPLTAGKTVSIDVTRLVTGNGLLSLGLTDNDATAISLASRESGHSPVLVVTAVYATPTPVPTAAPTLAPTTEPTASPAAQPSANPTADASLSPSPAPTPLPSSTPKSPPTSADPVRAAFFYPWFPEAWDQSGIDPFTHYHPTAGFYNGASSTVVAGQIEAMQYGKISVGIASWWGQGSQTDTKMPLLLSTAAGTGFSWSIYYEAEGSSDPSVSQISSDLAYINAHYGSNPSFYRINGRPVIFVYASRPTVAQWRAGGRRRTHRTPTTSCSRCSRGSPVAPASPTSGTSTRRPSQSTTRPAAASPSAPASGWPRAPYAWRETLPAGSRRSETWSPQREPWQLVTTFNEWGEGTAVEGATEWQSSSGYGAYLDALHDN